ncbi:MAG: 2-oxoglutarate dehydrogenase E1 component [Candidatus Neptunochlamydia sp.]|nr:2-oxoglutarate dehydrogenase E1 component [Candidatus Neptunochlamydia sp.]
MSDRGGFANLANITYIEQLYSQYLEDPESVDKSWQHFFEGMALGTALKGATTEGSQSSDLRVFRLIEAYRIFGHKGAQFNPMLETPVRVEDVEELSLKKLGFKEEELSQDFPTCGFLKEERVPLSVLIQSLQKTYCNSIGLEYVGIHTEALESFIQEKIESNFQLNPKEKVEILHSLNKSEIMESFIQMKYPGQKRFSLEGGETLIPMMMEIIHEGSIQGVQEIVLGMAHRGRLNILANILGKSYVDIFHEFESSYVPDTFEGSGDVKYHKGYSADVLTKHGKNVHVILCANPSHLEAIDSVVEGKTRAKQELKAAGKTNSIVPILIHGEAAIAGQGVVYETLQLSKLSGYKTGGTIHIIINNQIGFTASPKETKSTRYCTDIAKAFGAPIFHVNGEDPENAVAAAKLTLEIRQKFGCDVFLELNCHRKYGHNESDEPTFTNPQLYKQIKQKENVRNIYRQVLLEEGTLSKEGGDRLEKEFKNSIEKALLETQERVEEKKVQKRGEKKQPTLLEPVETAVAMGTLVELTHKFTHLPDGFHIHPKLKRILEDRFKMMTGDLKAPVVDWGMAEHLAYSSLLIQKIHVRLTGQDSGRGTFSHRHAILTDQETGQRYYPLSHLSQGQASFDIYNSPVTEYAVMGFEYGYSTAYHDALVMWEGQFGDFGNGGQIIIDQFIVAAEQKWNRLSPLTLLLPHGYEGQGPEHSSARVERFLQLAGNNSILIVTPSTPAQLFHILRRQGVTEIKKPLIIFTPKALLRYPPSLSAPEEFSTGTFQTVIDDPSNPQNVKRLILCTGKVYYDLIDHRKDLSIAIVRIEQLYPLDEQKIQKMLKKYVSATECFWVQEEHENMGAYFHIRPTLEKLLPEKLSLRYVGRETSASPAAGSGALHKLELAKFLKEALE